MVFKFIRMNLIIALLILSLFNLVLNNYIAIPFKIHKDDSSIFISDTKFISDYIINKLYFFLDVGTPYQKMIGKINSLEYEFLMKKGEFIFNEKNRYYFNRSLSYSFNLISDKTESYFDSFDSKIVQDNINLCINYNIQKRKCEQNQVSKMNFIFSERSTIDSTPNNDLEINYIEIGLNAKTHYGTAKYSLYKNLLENHNINNNIWFISYFNEDNGNNNDNIGDDDGVIIFGENPLNFFKDKYNPSFVLNTNGINREYDYGDYWSIVFNEIRLKSKDGSKDILLGNDIQGVINHNYHAIVGSEKYMESIEVNFFWKYISKNQCQKKLNGKFYYYSCNSNLISLRVLEENFPNMYLKQINLDYVFELNATDLFAQRGDEIFFLVIFNKNNPTNSFLLGSIFLKKYMFSFDNNNKQISFYRQSTNDEKKEVIVYHWYDSAGTVIVLIILFIAIGLVGFYYGKKIYYRRKLRANELEEQFEYKSSSYQQNNNNNNSKMDIEMKLGI